MNRTQWRRECSSAAISGGPRGDTTTPGPGPDYRCDIPQRTSADSTGSPNQGCTFSPAMIATAAAGTSAPSRASDRGTVSGRRRMIATSTGSASRICATAGTMNTSRTTSSENTSHSIRITTARLTPRLSRKPQAYSRYRPTSDTAIATANPVNTAAKTIALRSPDANASSAQALRVATSAKPSTSASV